MPPDYPALVEAFGARGLNVLLAQNVQEVGTHDACEASGPSGDQDDNWDPDVLRKINHLREAHRFVLVFP